MILVKKDDVIDAMDSTDWYHINKNGKLVSGANSDEDVALYKEADVYKAIDSVEPVDAIPIEWIENYICDLNTGKQTHHLDADEYISNSDEVYYLRYLLKKWKQEKEHGSN